MAARTMRGQHEAGVPGELVSGSPVASSGDEEVQATALTAVETARKARREEKEMFAYLQKGQSQPMRSSPLTAT
ncbi:MAG: hypothetical protein U0270_23465 [Labilithrix sp.]